MGMAREDEYLPPELSDEEIELSLEELTGRMEAATRESARLHKLYMKALKRERNRVPNPGWDYFQFSLRYTANRGRTYHYAAFRAPDGSIYTTGGGDAARFRNWDALVRWLKDEDKNYVSALTRMTPDATAEQVTVR